jgi:hypothetical protein
MKRRNVGSWLLFAVLGAAIVSAPFVLAETITWTNPTTGVNDNGASVALTEADQAAITNYIRYKPIGGTWTYLGETRGGKTSWTGTLPLAEGIAADYSVSAALVGPDGVERDSWTKGEAVHSTVRYTRPFPAGPTPGAPGGLTITP